MTTILRLCCSCECQENRWSQPSFVLISSALIWCLSATPASLSPAPVLACQPNEVTSALTIPFLMPLSTVLHVNASINRSEVKGSQHWILMMPLWSLQCQLSFTSLSFAVVMGCAIRAAMTFQEGSQREILSFFLKITRSRLSLVAR